MAAPRRVADFCIGLQRIATTGRPAPRLAFREDGAHRDRKIALSAAKGVARIATAATSSASSSTHTITIVRALASPAPAIRIPRIVAVIRSLPSNR